MRRNGLEAASFGCIRPFPDSFGIFRPSSRSFGSFRLYSALPISLGPFRSHSALSASPRSFPPPLGSLRPVPQRRRCHGRWSPLAARSVLPGPGGDALSVLPGPRGRAQRAPEPVRDGLRAGDLGGGAGRGRGAGAAAAGAARGPRGARPGGVHGTALRQPERAPRRVPAAAGARGPVRCPHPRRCHPAAPRLLLRAPRRHRAAAGTRSRPRRRRRRRQNRPAQGRRAGAPRALRPPPAPAPGPRRPPRCPGPQPAGRGAPGRVGPAGHLRGHGGDNRARALSQPRCPSRSRRGYFRVPPARPAHYPSPKPITSRLSPAAPPLLPCSQSAFAVHLGAGFRGTNSPRGWGRFKGAASSLTGPLPR